MRVVVLVLFGLLLNSCDSNKWNGYSVTKSGLYYKIHALGDGKYKAKQGDKIFAQISVENKDQKIIYQNGMQQGAFLAVELGEGNNATISEALSLLHSGDSASFVFPNKINAKKISNGKLKEWASTYVLHLKLNRIVGEISEPPSSKEVDLELEEIKKLHNYLAKNKIDPSSHTQGVYLKTLKEGSGAKAQSGQNLWIAYTGRFLNGEEFDNTNKAGQLLDFQLGKPDQVIKAFEIALHQVKVGGKIQVISSSEFAFGGSGSSTGIVAPYTSVVYEIELVKAQ